MDRRKLVWIVVAAAALILTYQLFIPHIVGLADQGDLARILGKFGYGSETNSTTRRSFDFTFGTRLESGGTRGCYYRTPFRCVRSGAEISSDPRAAAQAEVLRRIGKAILILLFISPAIAAIAWIRLPGWRRDIELLALLSAGCLTAFLTAALGDAWDNVKHLFLFNLMLDAWLIFGAGFLISLESKGSPSSKAAPAIDD